MGIRIEDGRGKGNEASVNADHQLLVEASTLELGLIQAHRGRAFLVNSGLISLTTTGSFNGILYILNSHQTDHMHIASAHFGINNVLCTFKITKNPSTGTLISGGTLVTPPNVNFGSGATFIGTAKKGADGLTVTDGIEFLNRQVGEPWASESLRFATLTPGTSLAVSVQPSASATVNASFLVFYHYAEQYK